MSPPEFTEQPAWFSENRVYRYWLRRTVSDALPTRPCLSILLNPATADEERNDNTTSVLMGFVRRWGFTDHCAVNAFGLVNKNPAVLGAVDDPIGPSNQFAILAAIEWVRSYDGIILLGWGNGALLNDQARVLRILLTHVPNLHVFGWTQAGQPRFPRAIPRDTKPTPITWEELETRAGARD